MTTEEMRRILAKVTGRPYGDDDGPAKRDDSLSSLVKYAHGADEYDGGGRQKAAGDYRLEQNPAVLGGLKTFAPHRPLPAYDTAASVYLDRLREIEGLADKSATLAK